MCSRAVRSDLRILRLVLQVEAVGSGGCVVSHRAILPPRFTISASSLFPDPLPMDTA